MITLRRQEPNNFTEKGEMNDKGGNIKTTSQRKTHK